MSNRSAIMSQLVLVNARTLEDFNFFNKHYVNRLDNFKLFSETGNLRDKILKKIYTLLEVRDKILKKIYTLLEGGQNISDETVDAILLMVKDFLNSSEKLRKLVTD